MGWMDFWRLCRYRVHDFNFLSQISKLNCFDVDHSFDTITYTSKLTTTTDEETVTLSSSHARTPSSSPTTISNHSSRTSWPATTNTPSSYKNISTCVPPSSHPTNTAVHMCTSVIPPIPHPNELLVPHPDEDPDAYWIITVG